MAANTHTHTHRGGRVNICMAPFSLFHANQTGLLLGNIQQRTKIHCSHVIKVKSNTCSRPFRRDSWCTNVS